VLLVPCELPVLELELEPELVEPVDAPESDWVVELESVLDGLVTAVVEVVADDAPVVVEVVPSPWPLTAVPSPLGVAPPPGIIVDEPPVFWDFSFEGTVIVVVDVVTVVGVAEVVGCDVAAILTACVWGGTLAATGAASSGGSTLTAADADAGGVTCRVAGATSAACAW